MRNGLLDYRSSRFKDVAQVPLIKLLKADLNWSINDAHSRNLGNLCVSIPVEYISLYIIIDSLAGGKTYFVRIKNGLYTRNYEMILRHL